MLKLVQGYYHFLALGKFMEGLILSNDLSTIAMDYPIKTWEKSSFLLKESLLKNLLSSLNAHPDQRNIYGYLTEISAFKGIFSTIRELIETSLPFRNFLKHQLQDQYFPFEQTIRFLRNVLNHATTGNLLIKLEDYDIQKDYILSPKIQRVNNLKGSALIKFDFYLHQLYQRTKRELRIWHLIFDWLCKAQTLNSTRKAHFSTQSLLTRRALLQPFSNRPISICHTENEKNHTYKKRKEHKNNQNSKKISFKKRKIWLQRIISDKVRLFYCFFYFNFLFHLITCQ